MSADRLRYIPLGLAVVLPLFIYARWPSYQWNVDGVACAAALELGNPVYLFHADHLIYGGVGFAVWKCLLHPLGVASALPALQIVTFLMTVAGLAGLFLLLSRRRTANAWLALALTLTIAVSAVVWVWSVEAQVYALGFGALAWATYALLEGRTPAALYAAGILYGVAILGHLMHILWIVPAAYWILQSRPYSHDENSRRLGIFSLLAAATAGAGYLLVFTTVLLPAHLSHWALMNWIKGSVGLNSDRHWAWHTQGLLAPLKWAHSTACFFWGSLWHYGPTAPSAWIWAITIVSMGAICVLLAGGVTSEDSARRNFALLWIGAYAVLLWTWEPSTLCYRMTEGIPLALLLSLGLVRLRDSKIQAALAGGILISLFIITWKTRIAPMHQPENNMLYTQTIALADQTPPQSLYLTDGGVTWIYLLYFTRRTALNVYQIPPATLEGAMAEFRQHGAPVLLDANVPTEPAAPAWIGTHPWKPLANLPWMELQ